MDEWTCDECKHRDSTAYSITCYTCVDGDEFEPIEGNENE